VTISNVDLTILIAYLLATVLFGVWIGRGQRSAQDYLLGGRDMPWWALLISIVATETSTATFLSVPGIAFGGTKDLTFLQLPIGYLVGRTIAAFALVPLYFRGEMFTAYDVLNKRSGSTVRTLASGLFLVTRTLADGLRLYLAALVLQVMLGWDLWLCVTVASIATLVYTVLGGIRAVVWTDVIQFFVYMLGAAAALVILLGDLPGGLGGLWDSAAQDGRLRVFDFSWDLAEPYTFWAGLIGGGVLSICSHGVDQLIVQRYLCARNQRDAQRALLLSAPIVGLQFAFFLFLGLGLSYYFATLHPDLTFAKNDQAFPHFVVHHLPAGLVGIVLGAVFAAAMSTLSSSLSASASALVNDFVLPITRHRPDEPFALRASQIATVLFALLQALVGVCGLGGGSVVGQVLAIAGVTTGVILGLFLLALHDRPDPTASLCGLVAGLLTIVTVVFVLPGQEVNVAWPWQGLLTCSGTYLVGGLVRTIRRPV
jgi:SSS family solute:Na+ symporter